MISVVDRISQFNSDRIPERVALKYQAMKQNAFAFFRGTCHLFYDDLQTSGALQIAPSVWSCGDLHLQNFGTFKGDAILQCGARKLVYFDVNDFDESALIPSSWDLVRLVTSVLLENENPQEALALAQNVLTTYAKTLATGKAGVLYRENASGVVKDLLQTLRKRDRAQFLKKRLRPKTRALLRIPNKILTVSPAEIHTVNHLIQTWASTQPQPDFFRVLDITHRIAGSGSLGVPRYLILVQGRGYPKGCYLLDLKAARRSSLVSFLTKSQPNWSSEGDRIVQIQTRLQASPPALLSAIESPGQSYVLRELQPSNDKIDPSALRHQPKKLTAFIQTLGEVVAWGHLRSSGRQGSAIADELIAFAQEHTWQTEILTYAQHYQAQIHRDYQSFLKSDL
ncbi:MAG: DUF2252 family protein [Alkalinema sp. FL-bin-369]|nr:DUF2252 family protein [Leptolyngbyaceae cyanobacterium LF-bin-369]